MNETDRFTFVHRNHINMMELFNALGIRTYAKFTDGAAPRRAGDPAGSSTEPPSAEMPTAPTLSEQRIAEDHAQLDRAMDIPEREVEGNEDRENIE